MFCYSESYIRLATRIVILAKADLKSRNDNVRRAAQKWFRSNDTSYPFSWKFIKDYAGEIARTIGNQCSLRNKSVKMFIKETRS